MNPPPYTTRGGWVTLPIEMIRAFSGRGSLPVYECNADDVRKRYCRVPPSTVQPKDLCFGAWKLAHAVKKADCARWPSSRILWPESAGFLLENIRLFDWSSKTLHLSSCMSDFHESPSRTSLPGRIGQGIALLFLEDKGYSYVGSFPTIIKQYRNDLKVKGRLKKYPDFVVENSRKEQALAEAKGSFVTPGCRAKIKDRLNEALSQLDGWNKCFSSQLHKNFAIGTFLREIGDPRNESSLTAFVDTAPESLQAPPGEPQDPIDFPPIEFPSDTIRRANYASWLSLMGFDDAARRLRAREGGPEERTVPLLTLGGRRYVIAITSIRPSYIHHAHDPDFKRLIREDMGRFLGLWGDGIDIEIVGLDLGVMQALQTTLQDPGLQIPIETEPEKETELKEQQDILIRFDGGEFHGSAFSDGSMIGEIGISDMNWSGIEERKITL